MTRPSVLPCSELGLDVLKSVPTTGNLCSVLTTLVPSDFWPTNPSTVTTTSSSGKMAVNPYQASASTCRLALSSPNFFTTAYGTPAQRTRRCHASSRPMIFRSGFMTCDFTDGRAGRSVGPPTGPGQPTECPAAGLNSQDHCSPMPGGVLRSP